MLTRPRPRLTRGNNKAPGINVNEFADSSECFASFMIAVFSAELIQLFFAILGVFILAPIHTVGLKFVWLFIM